MIISIKSTDFNLTLPIPLSLGGIIIRFTPKQYLNYQQKRIAIQLFKSLKGTLKTYKGLKIVEVVSQNGEYITIKL